MKLIDENVFDKINRMYPDAAKLIEENQVMQVPKVTRYISRKKRYQVLDKQDWCCNQCGCKLKYSARNNWGGKVAHVDHVHPFTERETYINTAGNINEVENLQALCPDCNLKKGKNEVH